MAFIQNIPLSDVATGWHRDIKGNGILIQIIDTDWDFFPESPYDFKEVHQFKFLDVEEDAEVLDEAMRISDEQAEQIAAILRRGLEQDCNIIVHCHAGVCRSGAVVEAGVRLGFEDLRKYRAPNRLVLKKLLKYLPECDFRPFQDTETGGSEFA
jgi:predicted protein tyrosine phosphatase